MLKKIINFIKKYCMVCQDSDNSDCHNPRCPYYNTTNCNGKTTK